MLLISRLVCSIVCLIATVFFIYHLKKGHRPLYFKCVFYGVLATFLTWVFYLAVSTDPNWNHIFSLGVFGEVSNCLFLATANLRFIPKEYEELNKNISVPGLLGALSVVLTYAAACYFNHSLDYLICNVLYASSAGLYIYTATDVIANKYKNPFKDGIKIFNLLFALYIFSGSILQLSVSCMSIPFIKVSLCLMMLLAVSAFLFGTYSLKKGLEPWEI